MFRRFTNRFRLKDGIYTDTKVLLILCVFASLLIHLASIVNLGWLSSDKKKLTEPKPVKIKFSNPPPVVKEDSLTKRVIEVKQQQTEPPKKSSFIGVVDHQTKKQTRLSKNAQRVKGADAGKLGQGDEDVGQGRATIKTQPRNKLSQLFSKIKTKKAKQRPLDAVMPTMGGGRPTAGYFDYIMDVSIEVGDVVDINTTKSMFIGYFASIRKSIELVWVYPKEAVSRNMQGAVRLQFNIQKNGEVENISVKRSSGYEILDKYVVNAVRLAAPFSPLPTAYQKDNLVVLATYHYVLQHGIAH